MRPTISQVLDCLNRHHVRATYCAVGKAIGKNHRNLGDLLEDHRWEASWVVGKKSGYPTDYKSEDIHPALGGSPLIDTAEELLNLLYSDACTAWTNLNRRPGRPDC